MRRRDIRAARLAAIEHDHLLIPERSSDDEHADCDEGLCVECANKPQPVEESYERPRQD